MAKNTAVMTFASIGQKVISFAYFTYVARAIGVEGTGKYFFALSFTTVFAVFVDVGLTQVLIRESARAKDRIQPFLETVLFIKLFTGGAAYLLAIGAVLALGVPAETRQMVYLSGVTMLLDSLHLTLYGVLRSLGDLRYEAASITASQLLTMILGSLFLYFRLPLPFLILAFVISSFLNVCFIGVVLVRHYGIRLLPRPHAETARRFARLAAPFAAAGIFARIYSYADTLILSRLAGDAAVGWYSIPYKITYAFQFIPLALVAAAYPRFSQAYADRNPELADLFFRSVRYLVIAVLPIAFGIAVLAPDLVLLLYTEAFLPSVLPLKMLIVSLIFSFVSFPIGALLNACDRQKTQTAIVGAVMILNIGLNLLLIPRFGATGAALAAAIGNACLALSGMLVVPRILPHARFRPVFLHALRTALAAVCMAALARWVGSQSHVLIAIAAGAVAYPAFLFLFRAVTIADISATIQMIQKKS